ncbi:MAG: HD domain-containing protein [Clostridiales bacterium]|nr:HD domain-containing protein [Clostridiales bacterium]
MLVNIGVLNLPDNKRYMDQWDETNINEFYEHVIHSHRILTKCDFMTRDMLQAVLYHHEKYDGSGYPRNISGKQIPLLSRIIYIADLYAFYTIRKEYNSLRAVSTICQEHLNEVDMEIFFTLSKRLFDYFTGQKFRTRDSDSLMGKIITFDQGTGNTIYDQSNVNVYIEQENKSVIPMSLNTFSNKNIEFL